ELRPPSRSRAPRPPLHRPQATRALKPPIMRLDSPAGTPRMRLKTPIPKSYPGKSRTRRRRRWRGRHRGRERRCRALRRLAVGPRAGLSVGPRREHIASLARHARGVFGREIYEHCREDRVVLDVVEADLVVRIAVRVPRVATVVPIARAESEAGRAAGHEGRVIGAATARRPRERELD